jgi:hypothetical protein
MPVNRFYTASLPQYTSQFVEDRTPWDKMLAIEEAKINRTDKVNALAGETDALTGSLTGGYQTDELVPQVRDRYKTAIDNLYKKYQGNMFNSQAIKEISSLNAQFQRDPDVQLIKKDAQDSELYAKLKMTMKPGMIDPNFDPNTGEYYQYKSGEQYRGYDPLIDLSSWANERYSKIQSRVKTNDLQYRTVEAKDAKGNVIRDAEDKPVVINYLDQEEVEYRDETLLKEATKNMAQDIINTRGPEARYFSKLLGKPIEELTTKDIEGQLSPMEKENYILRQERKSTPIGTGSAKSKGDDANPLDGYLGESKLPATSIPAPNIDGLALPQENKMDFFTRKKMELIEKFTNDENYNAVKNNYGALRQASRGYTFLDRRIYEDPLGTLKMVEDYGKNDLSRLQKKDHQETLSHVKSTIEKLGITDKPFGSPIEANKVLYAYFDSEEAQKDFPGIFPDDVNDLTPQQRMYLNKNYYDYRSKEELYRPTMIPITNSSVREELNKNIFSGAIDADGKVKLDNSVSSIFLGARVVDLDAKKARDIEMDEEEKREVFIEGNYAMIEGVVTDDTNPYGPAMFHANINGKRYLVEASKPFVDRRRLAYNIGTMNLPKHAGISDFFAIRGKNPDGSTHVIDKWNKDKEGHDRKDTWMQVRNDISKGGLVITVYQVDPNTSDDPMILKPFDPETNPKGYMDYPNEGAINPEIDPLQLENLVNQTHVFFNTNVRNFKVKTD